MPTAEQTKLGYAHLWDTMVTTKPDEATAMARRIIANKARYLAIENKIGVPWIMAGVLHMRESDLDFRTHMHNGDPLTNYTYHVPAGRPKVDHGPPFSFEESTDDAFDMPGKNFDKLQGTWTLELMLFGEEGYNGWGYLHRGNSPYIWSWTSQYHGGKFVADGEYDPNHWDEQPGCAAIMMALATLDASAMVWTKKRAVPGSAPPAIIVKNGTRKERNAATAGAAGAATGATGTAIEKPVSVGTKVAVTFASVAVGTIGIAVAIIAGYLLARKAKAIKERWAGAFGVVTTNDNA